MKKKRIIVLLTIVVIAVVSTAASNSAVAGLVAGIPLSEQCELGIIESIGLTKIDDTPISTIWGDTVINIPSGHHILVYDYSNNTYGSARGLSKEFDFKSGKHYSLRRFWGDSFKSGMLMGIMGAQGEAVFEIVENGNAKWNIPGIENTVPNDKEGVIVFNGKKVSSPLVVIIDGEKIFTVNKKETVSIRLSNGSHNLSIVRERDDHDPEGVDVTVASNTITAILSCSGMTGAKSIKVK
jgi:hypothetical protein